MSFKTFIIILLSILITVIFMQNTDTVIFHFLWMDYLVSKLVMMLIVTIFGFIIGVIVARPKKRLAAQNNNYQNVPMEVNTTDNENAEYLDLNKPNRLSDADRDYIN